MKRFSAERSDDVTALAHRVMSSFVGRSIVRFVRMEGFDRSIVLSAQAFTALIPLFIVVASAAPAGQEDVISAQIIKRFALTGEPAAAVEQLFTTPPGVTSSVSVFSASMLLYSGVAFTRRMQRMYRAAWGQRKVGVRSTVFATLGLLALVTEVMVASGVRAIANQLPLDWLWAILLSLATGLLLWTSIPYLLLDRQVHWRRLLVTGGTSAASVTVFAIATPIYMPTLMEHATSDFGLFGITITLIGYLIAVFFVLVACAAVGAELDAADTGALMVMKIRFHLEDPHRQAPLPEPAAIPRGLTNNDLLALVRIMKSWLMMMVTVWIATAVVPGIVVHGGFATYLVISLMFGLVNAVLGPLVQWLAGPLTWLTLGVSALLVNGLLFATTAGLSKQLDIAGFGSAVAGAFVVAMAGTLLELVLRPAQARAVDEPDV
jgi:uncharacterized membrane protein YvlD (DUF360 family)